MEYNLKLGGKKMGRVMKYFYMVLTAVFILFTAFEVYMYMKMDANYVGIFYLLFNFFIMFMLFTTAYNYDNANKKIRFSKNIIAIIIGVFTSFILTFILSHAFSYTDSSYVFNESIFVISKVIKPIIYFLILSTSILELKFVK